MIRLLLTVAALLTATPAFAQADKYDDGDWWRADSTGRDANVILGQGTGTRSGDKVTVPLYFFYPQPGEHGEIGIRMIAVIDCVAMTYDATYTTIFVAGKPPHEITPRNRGAKPLEPSGPLRRLMCDQDRTDVRFFQSRSRRAALIELFGRYPGE